MVINNTIVNPSTICSITIEAKTSDHRATVSNDYTLGIWEGTLFTDTGASTMKRISDPDIPHSLTKNVRTAFKEVISKHLSFTPITWNDEDITRLVSENKGTNEDFTMLKEHIKHYNTYHKNLDLCTVRVKSIDADISMTVESIGGIRTTYKFERAHIKNGIEKHIRFLEELDTKVEHYIKKYTNFWTIQNELY